jgi:predicted dinucleotide-binding enzyme
MRIAIIGPGGMGGGIGRLLARAGHEVVFSGSRNPQKLAHAAELAGPNARTASVPDAEAEAEVVVIAVPFDRYPDVAREAGEALRGKVVIDTSNPITVRDGQVQFLDIPGGVTAAQHQQSTLGDVRLVKAFNAICASSIDELAARTSDGRAAILLVGDDPAAKETAARLVEDANFVPVDVGALADAAILEPISTEDALPVLTEREARRLVPDRATIQSRKA